MTSYFHLNGELQKVTVADLPGNLSLNTYIRNYAKLTGTKYMCKEGGCGACTVVIKYQDPVTAQTMIRSANSCLTLLNTCYNCDIWTIEGIGNHRDGYNVIQKRLANMNGTQCGYCSPGWIMNMYALKETKGDRLTMKEVENSFGGNICRCTGYRPILDAMKSLAGDSDIPVPLECQDIEDLTQTKCPKSGELCSKSCQKPLDPITLQDSGILWAWPSTLDILFNAVFTHLTPDMEYALISGNTAHGVYRTSENIKCYIDITRISELRQWSLTSSTLTLGGNVTLTTAMQVFQSASKQSGFEYCAEIYEHFDKIATVPVRNFGTLAGNITIKKMYPEFASDIFLLMEALDVQIVVNRTENYTPAQYIATMNNKIVITSFKFKQLPKTRYTFKSFKIMPRAQNASAIVSAAILLNTQSNGVVNSARICFGGISSSLTHASNTENYIKNKCYYDKTVLQQTLTSLHSEINPTENLASASVEFRRNLACSLYYKFVLQTAPPTIVAEKYKSGGPILQRELSSGTQTYSTVPSKYPVTEPVDKKEALLQCSGEMIYANDEPTPKFALYAAFSFATEVGSYVNTIDASQALAFPGVRAFFSAKDIPGQNSSVDASWGYEIEEIFCSGKVLYYNQPVGLVVADTEDLANRAAAKILVTYTPPTLEDNAKGVMATVQAVIENNALERIQHQFEFLNGDFKLTAGDKSGHGTFFVGLQYHFTMEPMTCVAIPDGKGLLLYSPTQTMDHSQSAVAKMLNIKANHIMIKVRAVGGAYGSRISGANKVISAASLAAYKLNKPVRFVQSIESMMNCNGKRWACLSYYQFKAQSSGKIISIDNTFYSDAGCTYNENPVNDIEHKWGQNCYDLPNTIYRLSGSAVLTDAPSNIYCRAPASVEALAMIENIMEHVAFETGVDPADVRLNNLQPGDKMQTLLPKFITDTEYRQRRTDIDDFNSKNRWIKRGIGMSAMKYPIGYFGIYTATLSVYQLDGTVLISHGGIEMGQGINTKAAQVAAYELGIPFEYVKIAPSDTLNGANNLITGGSIGSDGVCYAVRKCCLTIKERLAPVHTPGASWLTVVKSAFAININLIASECFAYNDMVGYNVHGAALCEVKIDLLTGNIIAERFDIVEDAGESLSPKLDVGQVEGGCIMSLGYWLTEKLIYDNHNGKLLTNRTWNYKVPGAKDIPVKMNIELLQNSGNTTGFMSSKATGEISACIMSCIPNAVQHAIQSARNDAKLPSEFQQMPTPISPEVVFSMIGNSVDKYVLSDFSNGYSLLPWNWLG